MTRAGLPPCHFPVYHTEMPSYGIIYLVRNKTNGKVYIGRTTQPLALRWAGHVHDSKRNVVTGLVGAIKRHGPDAFAIEELETYPDKASLMLAERAAIDRYHSRDPNVGYNIMAGYKDGGDGYTGPGRHGQELRSKVLKVRVTEAQLEAMVIRAAEDGRTVSDWARIQLEGALDRLMTRAGVDSVVPEPEVTSTPSSKVDPVGGATVTVASDPDDELARLLDGMDFNVDG